MISFLKKQNNLDEYEAWITSDEVAKNHYDYLLAFDNPVRAFLDKYCSWIYSDCRHMTVDVFWVEEAIKIMEDKHNLDSNYIANIRDYMLKSNFGSMKINW